MNLTLIVPMYNVENYIERTLESIYNQSEMPEQILLIDDGSKDNTLQVVNQWCSKHSDMLPIQVLTQTNQGVSAARNFGLKHAIGKYILFLDSDDTMEPHYIQTVHQKLKDRDTQQEVNESQTLPEIIYVGYNQINENDVKTWEYKQAYQFFQLPMSGFKVLQGILEGRYYLWTCATLFRRDFIQAIGNTFTEGCQVGEDREFIYKGLLKATQVLSISEMLVNYRIRDNSLNHSFSTNKFQVIGALQRVVQVIPEEPQYNGIRQLLKNKLIPEEAMNNWSRYIHSKGNEAHVLYNTYHMKQLFKQYELQYASTFKSYLLIKISAIVPSWIIKYYQQNRG